MNTILPPLSVLELKVDDKPVIQGSFIRIGKDTFVTPVAGMTCKIVPVSDVEGIDKGNSI